MNKERLRKLLEDAKYLCESTCLHSDPMEYIKAIQGLRKMLEDSLAAIDDTAGVMKWVKASERLPKNENWYGPTRTTAIDNSKLYHNKRVWEMKLLLSHELELDLEWLDDQSPSTIDKE